ncbi:hypothetical protein C8Q80DRAFT_150634 [Daedaleopsis nitida]|nr:hypothetical protein C8Q80DRAFT_150634 [Daedaleopsis nitida]
MNYPAISSMEVEVSGSEEDVPAVETKAVSGTPLTDPKTPQRASEVFGFLSRRNTLTVKERDLPPIPQTMTPEFTGDTHQLQSDLSVNDNSLGEHLDATPSANTSHSTQLTSSDTNSHASHAQIQTATMTKLSSAFAASTTSLNLLISHERDEGTHDLQTTSTSKEVPTNHAGTTSASSTHAASHFTGSSLSSNNSMKVPPSKIPRGPRPRPHSICRRDKPETPENDMSPPHVPITVHQRRGSDTNARSSKREAFTHIPQRQHGRIASCSSARSDDSAPGKLSEPSSRRNGQSKKRSTKPEQFAIGKENTPSPPPVSRRRESVGKGESAIPVKFGFTTPERHHVLIDPPSRASSSELSPVTRNMMDNLRRQRARVRNGERMRAFWTRD